MSTELSDEFITSCRRAFDREPSTQTLLELLGRAFAAGRLSALDRDEWRVVTVANKHMTPDFRFPEVWSTCESEADARIEAAAANAEGRWGEAFVEHRRTGRSEWQRALPSLPDETNHEKTKP